MLIYVACNPIQEGTSTHIQHIVVHEMVQVRLLITAMTSYLFSLESAPYSVLRNYPVLMKVRVQNEGGHVQND
jgi:hypothetical protein